MTRGGVVKVDSELGEVVRIWEGVEVTFMALAVGNRVHVSKKVYLFKDRLYEEPWIPEEIFNDLCGQAGAIFKGRRKKRLERLLEKFSDGNQKEEQFRKERAQQLSLF